RATLRVSERRRSGALGKSGQEEDMKDSQARRGIASVEFAFGMIVLTPLLLGTGVIGVNLIRTLETVQVARDAGHMYARGVDFSQPGNKTIVLTLASNLGLSTSTSTSNALVILS